MLSLNFSCRPYVLCVIPVPLGRLDSLTKESCRHSHNGHLKRSSEYLPAHRSSPLPVVRSALGGISVGSQSFPVLDESMQSLGTMQILVLARVGDTSPVSVYL